MPDLLQMLVMMNRTKRGDELMSHLTALLLKVSHISPDT